MRYKGIFVGGIPGSGCTLMRRLFLSFKNVIAPEYEMFTDQFVQRLKTHRKAEEILVASRCGSCVYSQGCEEGEAERQAKLLVDSGAGVLVMTRDCHSQRRLSKEGWVDAMSDTLIHWDKIHYTLPYGRLVAEPDVVQLEVAEVFGLTLIHEFSDYPDFIDPKTIPHSDMKGTGFVTCHNLRRIGDKYDVGVSGERYPTAKFAMMRNYEKLYGEPSPSSEAVESLKKLLGGSEEGKELEVSEVWKDEEPEPDVLKGHELRRIGEEVMV